ncbi:MAG: hypothetical protein GXO77_15085 [Calditrichaeota bacterium]|nr:hypothetical protein [Calditrichota bacterium]
MTVKVKLFYYRLRYYEVPKIYLKAYWLKMKRSLQPNVEVAKVRRGFTV